jgi:hypothetical protein
VTWKQGDQMSLWKNAQNVAQTIFCQNKLFVYVQKSNQKIWVPWVIKKYPIGKYSPNLVTLLGNSWRGPKFFLYIFAFLFSHMYLLTYKRPVLGISFRYKHLKTIFGLIPLFIFFYKTQTMLIKSITQQHCYVFPKNLTPWRDSNPGLLLLRRMRCPMRHATLAWRHLSMNEFHVARYALFLKSYIQ